MGVLKVQKDAQRIKFSSKVAKFTGAGRFGHMTIRLQDLGHFGYRFLRQLGYNSETVENLATTNSVTKFGQFGYSQGEYKSRKI